MPLIEARKHYGVAQLRAQLANMMGGKRPPKEEPKEPPLEEHELFTPDEMLPFFAYLEEESDQELLTRETARALAPVYSSLPEWAKKLVPIEMIHSLLGT